MRSNLVYQIYLKYETNNTLEIFIISNLVHDIKNDI